MERFLGTTDLRLYKTELWGKYHGAADYDQGLHRDYGNHTLVVPKLADGPTQVTSIILLSDVTELDGPTKVVPLDRSDDVPLWPPKLPVGEMTDREVAVTGPAGTLYSWRTDVLHRGSAIRGEGRSRFVMLTDFDAWGTRWTGKVTWADSANRPGSVEMLERATVRERLLFGFPALATPTGMPRPWPTSAPAIPTWT